MATLWHDIRFGLRMLLKSPGFTALAVLALALGIGANTAIFSVAVAILQKPVSFPHLDRLVAVPDVPPQQSFEFQGVSPADYFDWKRQSQSFESVTSMQGVELNLTGKGDPEKIHGNRIPSNFFAVLGIGPVIGRAFLPEEEQSGRDQEVILKHGLWQSHFGSDPNILGQTINLNGRSYTVVGVMGEEFNFPSQSQVFLPLALDDSTKAIRSDRLLEAVARLKPGVSIRDAQAEMFTIAGRLQQQFPEVEKGWSVRVVPINVWLSGELVRPVLPDVNRRRNSGSVNRLRQRSQSSFRPLRQPHTGNGRAPSAGREQNTYHPPAPHGKFIARNRWRISWPPSRPVGHRRHPPLHASRS